ncbi:MAG: V-type ATP synthase subunit F [Spirochaetes bacterium]|jgi:V/A-type H+-transporting ATPase subunit F|nr:V-type ATP synthase subunit F [Spirochaetota bacterium]
MASYRIAMIGDDSSTGGFAAGGVVGVPAATPSEALERLNRLVASGEYAIVFITEGLAEPILADIAALPRTAVPAVVVVPDQGGSRGIGFRKIQVAVEKALGLDLLGKEGIGRE